MLASRSILTVGLHKAHFRWTDLYLIDQQFIHLDELVIHMQKIFTFIDESLKVV